MLSAGWYDHVAFTTRSLVPVLGGACFSFKGREKLPGLARDGHHLVQEGTPELVAEVQGEGRMSPLHVRERSGKLVIAR